MANVHPSVAEGMVAKKKIPNVRSSVAEGMVARKKTPNVRSSVAERKIPSVRSSAVERVRADDYRVRYLFSRSSCACAGEL